MIKCPNCGNTKRIALSATDGKAYCTVYHLEGTGCGYAGPKTEFQEPEVTGYRQTIEQQAAEIERLQGIIKEWEMENEM